MSKVKLTEVKLSQLHSNPYRNLRDCPLDEDKIAELVKSMKMSEVWPNIEVRKAPSGRGFQIAYGHHRIKAARRALGKAASIPVLVREMSDEAMLLRMARENGESYDTDMNTLVATAKAVLAFYVDRGECVVDAHGKFGCLQGQPTKGIRTARAILSDSTDGIGWRRHVAEGVIATIDAKLPKAWSTKDNKLGSATSVKVFVADIKAVEKILERPFTKTEKDEARKIFERDYVHVKMFRQCLKDAHGIVNEQKPRPAPSADELLNTRATKAARVFTATGTLAAKFSSKKTIAAMERLDADDRASFHMALFHLTREVTNLNQIYNGDAAPDGFESPTQIVDVEAAEAEVIDITPARAINA